MKAESMEADFAIRVDFERALHMRVIDLLELDQGDARLVEQNAHRLVQSGAGEINYDFLPALSASRRQIGQDGCHHAAECNLRGGKGEQYGEQPANWPSVPAGMRLGMAQMHHLHLKLH